MRSICSLIPKLEKIVATADAISRDLPSIDLITVATTLILCEGDAEKAAQILVNLHVKQISRRRLERMQGGAT